jgi:hypothetical protein
MIERSPQLPPGDPLNQSGTNDCRCPGERGDLSGAIVPKRFSSNDDATLSNTAGQPQPPGTTAENDALVDSPRSTPSSCGSSTCGAPAVQLMPDGTYEITRRRVDPALFRSVDWFAVPSHLPSAHPSPSSPKMLLVDCSSPTNPFGTAAVGPIAVPLDNGKGRPAALGGRASRRTSSNSNPLELPETSTDSSTTSTLLSTLLSMDALPDPL